jgi:hypothetical protein
MSHYTCVSLLTFVCKTRTLERKHSPTTLIIYLCVFTQYKHHHLHHNQFQNVALKSKPLSATRTKTSIQRNCGEVPSQLAMATQNSTLQTSTSEQHYYITHMTYSKLVSQLGLTHTQKTHGYPPRCNVTFHFNNMKNFSSPTFMLTSPLFTGYPEINIWGEERAH